MQGQSVFRRHTYGCERIACHAQTCGPLYVTQPCFAAQFQSLELGKNIRIRIVQLLNLISISHPISLKNSICI